MGAKKILILEDDATLAGALAGAVKKAGYESVICSHPEEALQQLDKNSFKVVFIDCLLPQTPGVEVAKSIRKNFDSKILPIVMMSGIFTDKQMMKDITQEVSALDFLKKPFEVTEVLKFLEKDSVASNDETLSKSIFSLPDRLGAAPAKRNEILQTITKIHGFELPILLSSMAGNACSGVIHLSDEKGELSKISFYKGNIVGVESPDTQSFLGKLLVANGWVMPEDLEMELSRPSEKKLGQRLIEENLISPHAVFDVMEKQMAFRLERMFHDKNYLVKYEDKVVESNDSASIDAEEFYLLLDHWIRNYIPTAWLDQQMSLWNGYSVEFGPSHDPYRHEYEVACIGAVDSIIGSIESRNDLSILQKMYQDRLSAFHKAFYYMLCLRFILFTEKVQGMSEQEKIARLQKLWLEIKDLNLINTFLQLGGRRDMSREEVETLYNNFVRKSLNGINNFEANSQQEQFYVSVKEKVAAAYNLFLDPQNVIKYEREQETGHATKRTQSQTKMEEAKKFLALGQYTTAAVLVNKAIEIYPNIDMASLFQVWCRVGMTARSKNIAKDLLEIDQMLLKISNEEKNSAIGCLVQGLVAKTKKDRVTARTFFEKALATDKGLIEARRELNKLPPPDKKSVDLLHGDLGAVISNLFKKS